MLRIFSAMNSHHSRVRGVVEQQVGVVAGELGEAGAPPHLLEERQPLLLRSRRRWRDRARGGGTRASDVFSVSRIASKSARSCACSSGVIGALLSGVHQLAVRWYTVSEATSPAMAGISCTPLDPVPMTATRLPAKSTGVAGHRPGVVRLAAEVLASGHVREVRHREHAGRGDEEPRAELGAVAERDGPRPRRLVVHGRGDRGVEPDVAPEVEAVDDVVEVALGLRLLGEVLLPLPLVEQLLARTGSRRCSSRSRTGRRGSGSSTRCRRRRRRLRAAARRSPLRGRGTAGRCR